MIRRLLLLIAGVLSLRAQDAPRDGWTIHFQATSIGQHHGPFASLYEGETSLPPHSENRVSLTSTVFVSYRLNGSFEFVVNPEVAGGKGFGNVTGIAGFPNGEIPRVAGATPKLYAARAYMRNTIARHLVLVTGKFSITDFFDNNTYSHDPRRQFMNWALMSNGAWDYPADTRGYTVGAMQELNFEHWSVRAAEVLMPTIANGGTFDTRVAKNRGLVAEYEHRHRIADHPGAVRLLGFENRERAGTLRDAILADGSTDLAATRRPGTKKYGFGANVEQEIAPDLGAFARYGWSDGRTETWAFTQIDRSLSAGLALQGRRWRRRDDTVGLALVTNGLSGDDRRFLADGGVGFIIGDGHLNYGRETALETYYAWHALRDWTVTLDYQRVENPAYNRDRGPVSVASLRLHWER